MGFKLFRAVEFLRLSAASWYKRFWSALNDKTKRECSSQGGFVMSLELLFVPLGLAVGHTALSVVLTTTRLAKFIHLIFLV